MKAFAALTVVSAALLVLAGCGSIARHEARNEMEQSKAAYKECLRNHPADTSACGALREVFEVDLRAFRALKVFGGTVTIEEE